MPKTTKRWIAGQNVEGAYVAIEISGRIHEGRFYVDHDSYTTDSSKVLGWRRNLPENHVFTTREAAIRDECDRAMRDIEVQKSGLQRLEQRFWGFKKLLLP